VRTHSTSPRNLAGGSSLAVARPGHFPVAGASLSKSDYACKNFFPAQLPAAVIAVAYFLLFRVIFGLIVLALLVLFLSTLRP
jgi:hypothetical protein